MSWPGSQIRTDADQWRSQGGTNQKLNSQENVAGFFYFTLRCEIALKDTELITCFRPPWICAGPTWESS